MSRGRRSSRAVRVYRTRGSRRRRWSGAALFVASTAALIAAVAWTWSSLEEGRVAVTPVRPSPVASVSVPPGASPSAGPPTKVIEIGWVGDTTPGSSYGLPPDEGRALFAQVRDELSAPDLMIANLEGTYSDPGPSKCDDSDSRYCLAFQAPPSYAKALVWAGVDLVSLANNHAHDYLGPGLEQTKATLKRNKIKFTGMPGQVTYVRVNGVDVAALAFSPYYWNASLTDIPAAQALVRTADARADVVVVLIHAGAEGAGKTHTPEGAEYAFGENRGASRAFAHAVVDAGADLVLGSGPHVVRGIERYGDRLIAYSLGNFAGWDNFGLSGNLRLSGLLTVKVDAKGRIRGGRWLSLHLDGSGVPAIDADNTAAHMVARLSQEDFPRTFKMDREGYFTR